MSTAQEQNARIDGHDLSGSNGSYGQTNGNTSNMTKHEHETAKAAARFGYGPLAHVNTAESRLPAFGGEFQPGTFAPVKDRKFANPAPLGLCAFALTTFVLSLINVGTRGVAAPNIVVGAAFGYGGLVQLLAGMWEMAVGNTFGATALSSYGGFWIAFGIIFTPGGFNIVSSLGGDTAAEFWDSLGFFMMGWFIFTTIILLATLRSTVAFFFLFFTLDLTFMLLGISYLHRDASGAPRVGAQKAGGVFGLLAAFAAWYNAFAGIVDDGNSFFVVPVVHFPWSVKGIERKKEKSEKDTV